MCRGTGAFGANAEWSGGRGGRVWRESSRQPFLAKLLAVRPSARWTTVYWTLTLRRGCLPGETAFTRGIPSPRTLTSVRAHAGRGGLWGGGGVDKCFQCVFGLYESCVPSSRNDVTQFRQSPVFAMFVLTEVSPRLRLTPGFESRRCHFASGAALGREVTALILRAPRGKAGGRAWACPGGCWEVRAAVCV